MAMPAIDEIGLAKLLEFEADVAAEPLDGFLAFIRRRYALTEIAYYCPAFRGRSLADPFLAVAPAGASPGRSRALYKAIFEPAFSLAPRAFAPVDWAPLRLRERNGIGNGNGDRSRRMDHRRQGLTIPVRGPDNGLWALFGVTSQESDHQWSKRRYELTRDLVHVAHYVHQRACNLHAHDAPIDLNAITRREIEALELCAGGKNPSEIAVAMRISLETVKAHLDSARFKLQALNRVHAVAKAIRAGLVR